jgi:hypothetical protein
VVENNYYETPNVEVGSTETYTPEIDTTNFIPEIRNEFTNYNTDITPYQTSSYNPDVTSTIPYETSSYNQSNIDFTQSTVTNNYSEYQSTTVPTTSQYIPNDDEELIPVEEIEYVPVKKQKLIRRKKIKVKKTIVVPKKVVVKVPVKQTIVIPKKETIIIKKPTPVIVQNPKPVVRYSTPAPHPVVIKRSIAGINYRPKVYRSKI